jgi:unsaturated rhamnogalacturonyl hydrolase
MSQQQDLQQHQQMQQDQENNASHPAEIESGAKRILEAMLTQKSDAWNLSLSHWDWSQGVGLYGITRMYEWSGNRAYAHFLRDWFRQHAGLRQFGSVNYVCLANSALMLLKLEEELPEQEVELYRSICEEFAEWCLNKALLTANGGFAHVWGKGGLDDYKNQLWIDTVFMAGIFMIDYGLYAGWPELVEAGIRQYDIHSGCLYNPETGLFYHGYHALDHKQLGEHWGRGNGWMAASLAELLRLLEGTRYDNERFRSMFLIFMENAYRLRTEEGMLRTVLSLESSYTETTATALFGYAALLGAELGILPGAMNEWGHQAAQQVLRRITPRGEVEEASGGTDCQELEGYLHIPFIQSLYAYGTVLMVLAAELHSPKA